MERARRSVRVRVQNFIGLPGLESAPEPDIAWVVRRNYAAGRHQAEDMLLIVEVADSSLRYDLGEKADLDAEAGVRDYWVVDAVHRRVTVMREPKAGRFDAQITFCIRCADRLAAHARGPASRRRHVRRRRGVRPTSGHDHWRRRITAQRS